MPSVAPNVDDTRATEYGEVLRDRAKRHVRHRIGDHPGRELVVPHELQNVLAARFGDNSQQVAHNDILVMTEIVFKGSPWCANRRWCGGHFSIDLNMPPCILVRMTLSILISPHPMQPTNRSWLIALLMASALPHTSSTGASREAIAAPQSAAPSQSADTVVRIERIAAKPVLIRTVTGPYSKHPEAFTEFMRFAESKYLTVGRCFGIYPTDPDAIKGDPTWMIGVEVSVGSPGHVEAVGRTGSSPAETLRRLATPKSPGYRLRELPAVQVATLHSTVARSASDGLRLVKWLADNGYAQVGPTRMEYLSHDGPPNSLPTRIVVPVVARHRQIRPSH
jgi:hypothetical protein